MTTETQRYDRSDFQTDQEVRWCPGCGDCTILASVQNLLAEMDLPRENHVFVLKQEVGTFPRFFYFYDDSYNRNIQGVSGSPEGGGEVR